jgi:hypothetical protein
MCGRSPPFNKVRKNVLVVGFFFWGGEVLEVISEGRDQLFGFHVGKATGCQFLESRKRHIQSTASIGKKKVTK